MPPEEDDGTATGPCGQRAIVEHHLVDDAFVAGKIQHTGFRTCGNVTVDHEILRSAVPEFHPHIGQVNRCAKNGQFQAGECTVTRGDGNDIVIMAVIYHALT